MHFEVISIVRSLYFTDFRKNTVKIFFLRGRILLQPNHGAIVCHYLC